MAELMGLNTRTDELLDSSLLKISNPQGIQAKLVKADFHGSILTGDTFWSIFQIGC